jgi:hypothetical protein
MNFGIGTVLPLIMSALAILAVASTGFAASAGSRGRGSSTVARWAAPKIQPMTRNPTGPKINVA